MRTVIMGDVHGCYDALMRLLRQIEFDDKKDRLISIGDLMDRGAEPYLVFSFFKEKKESMGENCILVRGNHEQMFLDASRHPSDKPLWMRNGGQKTLDSFEKHGRRAYDYAGWIEKNTVLYHVDEDGYQCVHADIFEENPADNAIDTLIWGRNNIRYGYYTGRLTIVGHTPLIGALYLPGAGKDAVIFENGDRFALPKTGMICIDTGCVFGEKLTALLIENGMGQIEQVKQA